MVDEGYGYEIVPHKEILDLKRQVEELKRKGTTSSEDLMNTMTSLTKSMEGMLNLFKAAAEEMKSEEKESDFVSKKLAPLVSKVEEVVRQNKTIAEGMLVLSDKVEALKRDTYGKKEEKPKLKKEPKMPEMSEPEFEKPEPFEIPEMPPMEEEKKSKRQMPPPFTPRGPPPREFGPPPRYMPSPPGPMPPPDFGIPPPPEPFGMPPLEAPGPDFGIPPPEEKPKKKGFLGLFKKK